MCVAHRSIARKRVICRDLQRTRSVHFREDGRSCTNAAHGTVIEVVAAVLRHAVWQHREVCVRKVRAEEVTALRRQCGRLNLHVCDVCKELGQEHKLAETEHFALEGSVVMCSVGP